MKSRIVAASLGAFLVSAVPAFAFEAEKGTAETAQKEFQVLVDVQTPEALTDQELASIEGQAPIGQIGLVNVGASVLDRANIDVRDVADVTIRNVQVGVLAAQRQ